MGMLLLRGVLDDDDVFSSIGLGLDPTRELVQSETDVSKHGSLEVDDIGRTLGVFTLSGIEGG